MSCTVPTSIVEAWKASSWMLVSIQRDSKGQKKQQAHLGPELDTPVLITPEETLEPFLNGQIFPLIKELL